LSRGFIVELTSAEICRRDAGATKRRELAMEREMKVLIQIKAAAKMGMKTFAHFFIFSTYDFCFSLFFPVDIADA